MVIMNYYKVHALFIFSLLPSVLSASWLSNYKAYRAYKKKEFAEAQKIVEEQITRTPQDAQALFNAGVLAYKQRNFEPARAYFDNAAQVSKNSKEKEEALFNRGNAEVQLNKLENALESYKQVLQLDPTNKRAKHNYDLVKKMLEEQKKKQQEHQKQEKEKQEKEKKEKENKEKSDLTKQQEQSQSQQDKSKQADDKTSQSLQDQQRQDGQKEDQSQRKQQGSADKQEQNNSTQQKEQGKGDEQKQQKEHELKSSREADKKQASYSQDTAKKQKEQALQEGAFNGTSIQNDVRLSAEEKQLVEILQKAEESVRKELIKGHIQQLPQSNDKNW